MTTALSISNISKHYRSTFGKKRTALDGININIQEGESFGFIGANGAGKSTTIKIIMGLMAATSGSCEIFGQSISDPKSRQYIGYVPETPILPDYLSPFEILEIGTKLHTKKVDRQHMLGLLERLGLAQVAKQHLRQFSKGMQQRTALAHALAINPKMLILDEPMSGLDPSGRKLVSDLLIEYKQSGGTLFFSSHALYDVERLADRYGLIQSGKLVKTESIYSIVKKTKYSVITIGDASLKLATCITNNRWEAILSEDEINVYLESAFKAGHSLFEIKHNHCIEDWFHTNKE